MPVVEADEEPAAALFRALLGPRGAPGGTMLWGPRLGFLPEPPAAFLSLRTELADEARRPSLNPLPCCVAAAPGPADALDPQARVCPGGARAALTETEGLAGRPARWPAEALDMLPRFWAPLRDMPPPAAGFPPLSFLPGGAKGPPVPEATRPCGRGGPGTGGCGFIGGGGAAFGPCHPYGC